MKPTTLLVSALATVAAAAPTGEKEVEKRSFGFDVNAFNNFNNFGQSVNLNYLLNINGLNLDILQLLAQQNNFNINGFANLFQLDQNQFQLQDLLLLQQLQDLQQFAQIGVLNSFDLSNFAFGGINNLGGILNTGLLGLGGVDLNAFVQPQVITQVQTVASQVLPIGGLLGSGISGGLNSGVFSGVSSPGVSSGLSSGAAVSSAPSTGAVTAAEQDAQEGGSSISRA